MRRISIVILVASLTLIGVILVALVLGAWTGTDQASEPGSSGTPRASATPPASVNPVVTPGIGAATGKADGPPEHEGDRAMTILEHLAASPRVSGTPGEAAAASYLAGLLRSYGYTTEVMEFEFDGDRFRAGTASADGRAFEALTLAGSPGGTVDAKAAYVGIADAAGVAGQDLTGRIAVADRGSLNFIDKYENVKAAGAIGLVVANNRPGPFSGNLTTLSSFPVVAVSQDDGAAFIAAAKAGKTVAINAPPATGNTKALNVIGRATAGGDCRVLVGGHFDTVPGAPGANDNASGASNVVELARAFAADGLDDGLCFALFGAEESGLYGSKALVERMQERG